MASCATAFLINPAVKVKLPWSPGKTRTTTTTTTARRSSSVKATAKQDHHKTELQYRKLGDSDLHVREITLGTMTFGQQNTEKESHEMLSYAFENGINILETAEAYPIQMKKET